MRVSFVQTLRSERALASFRDPVLAVPCWRTLDLRGVQSDFHWTDSPEPNRVRTDSVHWDSNTQRVVVQHGVRRANNGSEGEYSKCAVTQL